VQQKESEERDKKAGAHGSPQAGRRGADDGG
jgi:hypothetical protein